MADKNPSPSGKKKLSVKKKQLWVTLPTGSLQMLDQLVARKVVGDSQSAVVAYLVMEGLKAARRDYDLTLPDPDTPTPSSNAK